MAAGDFLTDIETLRRRARESIDDGAITDAYTADMAEIGKAATDHHPIGLAYEPTTQSVWVACYGGSIIVFDDSQPAA